MTALSPVLSTTTQPTLKLSFPLLLPLFADGRQAEFGAFLSSLDEGFVAGTRWARQSDDPSALEGSAMIGLRLGGAAARKSFAIAAELDKLWRD